jgi:hypothetical protein
MLALLLFPAPLLKAAELVTFWLEGLETANAKLAKPNGKASVKRILLPLL